MTASRKASPTSLTLRGVRSIAVVGVSGRRTKFGGSAFRELKKRGYEVFAVHPSMDMFEGVKCYRSLADLPVLPDCALVTIKPRAASPVVGQAVGRGIRTIWFQQGADFSEAAAQAERAGLKVVKGRCILMYAEPVGGLHRFHRFLSKLFGKY